MQNDDSRDNRLGVCPETNLSIQTLGRFAVSINGRSLTAQTRASKKIWNLFKYLLVNRENSQLPETIIDRLCPETCTNDPSNLLHVQVYRLRKILEEPSNAGSNSLIRSNNGCYSWNPDFPCHIDADDFVTHSTEARRLEETLPQEAVAEYQKALSYYRGDFLPENSEDEWVIPHRIYYRHLFIEDVLQLCKLLMTRGDSQQVLRVCEKAIILEPFEESFHTLLLENLLINHRQKEALKHYEYITALYYRDLGISPTQNLKSLYQRIMSHIDGKTPMEKPVVSKVASGSHHSAQWIKKAEFITLVSREQKQRPVEDGQPFPLYQFTMLPSPPQSSAQKGLMAALQAFLRNHLRKEDLLTQWSPRSIAGFLPSIEGQNITPTLNRLMDTYEKSPASGEHTLFITHHKNIESLKHSP